MKVLMIGPFPPILNGVTISNDFLFRSLIERGRKVSKINTETGKIASRQGDRISLSKILTFLSIYKNIFQIFGKSVVYITIGQTFWGLAKYAPFMVLCKVLGIPYVLHIHGGYICDAYNQMPSNKKRLFRFLIGKSVRVIALSTSLAKQIQDTFPKTNVAVVENFYDPELIKPTLPRTDHKAPHFLFLSNLMLGKGILEFLDALIILKKHEQLEFKVSIAGSIEKGIGKILSHKVKELADSVHFFGIADFQKKKELLYWSDIFVLPTWYIMEGQPLSIIEAYVTGNIVVSTHQGGIKDISNYETFYKVATKDAGKLAEALKSLNNQRADLKGKMQIVSQQCAERFAPERFCTAIDEILLAG
jgi:glycosyltransferase involved in cell wall biosynthesis